MTDAAQLPEDFLREMKSLLGGEYDKYTDSFQEQWKPGLRVNTLKVEPEDFKGMVPWDLEPVAWTGNGFYYDQPEGTEAGGGDFYRDFRPSKHPAYYAGLYYLQEPSAMAPAAMLPITPGDKVLDLCAAPGGKSTELAARLQGQGMLAANDISYSRARALLKNLELAGAANICVTSESPERLAQVWPSFFDKILVDAPCSGEGMFRREESMVKDWLEKGPDYYGPLQRQIMDSAVEMLKPGGMLLYSTCTFSRREDEDTVLYVLGAYPEMELVRLDLDRVPGSCESTGLSGCMRLFPHRLKGEGHFLALLRKGAAEGFLAGGHEGKNKKKAVLERGGGAEYQALDSNSPALRGEAASGPGIPDKCRIPAALNQQEDFKKFLSDVKMELDLSRIVIHQDHIYYLPGGLKWNLPLRFLRTGLLLGGLKKGRFEPSQALAMALRTDQYAGVLVLNMGDERILRYLKGETISLAEGEGPLKGWCLVAMGEFPLGWAKGSGMSLKNKYYPGWRWQ